MRIGHGYDVHKLVEGRDLILGGVSIPYEKGLLGHSDADVLTHALMDAMLGAAGLGDIGRHFPDTDEQYRGISSLELLKHVCLLLKDHGLSFGNADITLIAQKPKISPYIKAMEENLSNIIGCPISQINVKATTEERLGFTGEEKGMACHAVCLLKEND
ncbi:MAG: 2-C-methyl-D-erythritol 2,4-cyclodiphosphate synthase [Clostridia bacterium]|nr:2-C-methyl-D-erythritol 2,4-cyclodiphosphate synthase [Clostridia bacterium]